MPESSGMVEEHGTSSFQQFLTQKSDNSKVETSNNYAKYGISFLSTFVTIRGTTFLPFKFTTFSRVWVCVIACWTCLRTRDRNLTREPQLL